MDQVINWADVFFEGFRSFGNTLIATLPGIIGALLILMLGWLVSKLFSRVIEKLLTLIKFDRVAERMNVQSFLKKAEITKAPSKIAGQIVFWLLMLLVLITSAETIGWTALSEELSKLIGYLPKLLAAVIFFLIGVFVAGIVRDLIFGTSKSLGIHAGKIAGHFVYYLLLLMVSLTSLKQAGLDTSILTSNLLLILGAIMVAAAISYGFASREVLANILGSFFNRKTFSLGQIIEVDGQKGKIVEMNNVSVKLKISDDRTLVIPSSQLISKQVSIYTNNSK